MRFLNLGFFFFYFKFCRNVNNPLCSCKSISVASNLRNVPTRVPSFITYFKIGWVEGGFETRTSHLKEKHLVFHLKLPSIKALWEVNFLDSICGISLTRSWTKCQRSPVQTLGSVSLHPRGVYSLNALPSVKAIFIGSV